MTQAFPAGLTTTDSDGVCPLSDPDPWDVIELGGQKWPLEPPGYVVVSGAGIPRKLNIVDGNGQSGATVIYKGEKLSQFTLTLYLVGPSDWASFFVWRAVLAKPPIGAAAKALPISHPALAYLKIDKVLVEDESQPEPDGETGMWKVVVKLCQWRKPTPALGAPTGSADPTQPTPQSAAERAMADRLAQVQALAG